MCRQFDSGPRHRTVFAGLLSARVTTADAARPMRYGSITSGLEAEKQPRTGGVCAAILESDDRPDHRSAGHRGEGILHLVKSDLARDHLIQPQRAVQIPAHDPREELGGDHVAAAARCEGDLLVEETAPREGQRDRRICRWDADDHHSSAVPDHADGLCDRRGKAYYFERVIERPAGSRTSGCDGIAAARVDRVRRAELASPLELLWRDVDSDDPIGAGDTRALHDGQAHSAAADDRDARASADLRRVQCRAHSRHHAAGDQTRLVERNRARHRDGLSRMNDRAGSEGTGREDAGEMLAIARTADARLGGLLGLAQDRITASADRARATGDAPRDHDPVIRPHGGHRASDLLDDAGAFVTEEDREGHAPAVRDLDVEIGVADTARSQADEDLVVPEIIEGNRLNRDTLAGRVQHRAPIAHYERLRPPFLSNGRLVYRPRPWHGWLGG